jgi:tetratricopeptide (TPR) repeat protein
MDKQSEAKSSNGDLQFSPLPPLRPHAKSTRVASAGVPLRPAQWTAPEIPEPTAVSALSLPPRPDAVPSDAPSARKNETPSYREAPRESRSRRSRRTSSGARGLLHSQPVTTSDNPLFSRLAGMLFCAALFFALGLAAGLYQTRPSGIVEPKGVEDFAVASEQEEKLLDRAFSLMREGDGEAALRVLKELRTINPHLASLSYTTALAAAQSGEIAKAMAETDISLGKGERVSDSYALAAAVESLKPGSVEWQSMGDPRERGDFFLRQAIAADQANAAPRLELGIRLRTRGRNEEAAEMLESARLRLHPVDQAAVIDTTLLLIALEQTENVALPVDLDPDKNTASLMGAAHVALRRGDNVVAAELLTKAKNRLAPELYYYLVSDPAFAPYRRNAELAPLFQ